MQVNDIGTVFQATIKRRDTGAIVPLGSATALQMLFLAPGAAAAVTKAAVLTTDGSDGQMQYTTIDGDLSTPGLWQVQALAGFLNGTWHATVTTFTVAANLG